MQTATPHGIAGLVSVCGTVCRALHVALSGALARPGTPAPDSRTRREFPGISASYGVASQPLCSSHTYGFAIRSVLLACY